jgi:hypothetical protein
LLASRGRRGFALFTDDARLLEQLIDPQSQLEGIEGLP